MRTPATVRSALWLPLFDELADPLAIARLAVDAEEAGWDGFFVWDHVAWRAPVKQVAYPWVSLAAVAVTTERIRIGPMVTPPARRRPAKLARETATLDQLSNGRLTLGVGLGSDRFGHELSALGDELDDRVRGRMLDESLDILSSASSGGTVHHSGERYIVDGVRFLPRPAQHLGVPVWVAGMAGNSKPLRRAARYGGYFSANLEHPDQLAEAVDTMGRLREEPLAGFDFVVGIPHGVDPAPYVEAGATWWLPEFAPEPLSLERVRGVLADGPLEP